MPKKVKPVAEPTYDKPLGSKEACDFLGIGITKFKDLCHDKPHGFPVAKCGRKYLCDRKLLGDWRERWYRGEFEI